MKTKEIVAELRALQAEAYGAEATAQHMCDRLSDERVRKGGSEWDDDSRRAGRLGSLQFTTNHIARQLDDLIERMQPRRRGRR